MWEEDKEKETETEKEERKIGELYICTYTYIHVYSSSWMRETVCT